MLTRHIPFLHPVRDKWRDKEGQKKPRKNHKRAKTLFKNLSNLFISTKRYKTEENGKIMSS